MLHGDMDLARQMAYDFNDVSKYLFIDVNPIMPKAALKMGVCGEMVRRPLIPTTEKINNYYLMLWKDLKRRAINMNVLVYGFGLMGKK